jgi:arylsulfatase
MFATLARFTGARVPADRPMDSLDQSDFFLGRTEKPARGGFPIFRAERLQAVKRRNWKLHFTWQDTVFDPPVKHPRADDLRPLHRPRRGEAGAGLMGGRPDPENLSVHLSMA